MPRFLLIPAALVCLLTIPALADDAQPSFDCAKASTTVENAICANAILAALDADLAAKYEAALTAAADAEAMRAVQRDWSNQRGPACGMMPGADDEAVEPSASGITCLIDLYRSRLAQLAEAMTAPTDADPARLFAGLWQLKEVLAAVDPAMTGADQQGRLIRLDRHTLETLDGAGCAGPTLQTMAEARARKLDAGERALIEKADAANAGNPDGIAGFCLGRLFAIYLPAADGSLLVADAGAVYRLQRLSGSNP